MSNSQTHVDSQLLQAAEQTAEHESNSLAPYDAILLQSYGGPTGPDTVLPFMRNATRGRGIPDERLIEVSQHYALFGGVSPINEANERLRQALKSELKARIGADVDVIIGNRNWHPYVTEAFEELLAKDHRRVLSVATSAYGSYSGCRQYREDLEKSFAELNERGVQTGSLTIDRLAPYGYVAGFVDANVRALLSAIDAGQLGQSNVALPRVLFTTHSIPTAMNAASGGGRGSYLEQHLAVCRRVVNKVAELTGWELTWELVFCSRSGAPHIPWLEPDINDRLEQLAAEGVESVVSAPIGFLADHMEVKYDLDTEAKATAERLGMNYQRAATVGVDEAFVDGLVDAILEHAEAVREARDPAGRFDCGQPWCCTLKPAP